MSMSKQANNSRTIATFIVIAGYAVAILGVVEMLVAYLGNGLKTGRPILMLLIGLIVAIFFQAPIFKK